ncbi:MAG: threonine/serine exporter family protein [Clostridia bacterium]|nr:threonine/serine exporter family protein [Clostridia bacterium]
MEEETVVAEKIDYAQVLELALEVGVGLLSSGGSVSRVETAVDRICRAYGAEEANVAAFPSMIIASVRTADGSQESYMKRVYSTSNNLALLEKYNQLSRDICYHKYPVGDALKMCFDLAHSKTRNKWVTIVGSALVAGTYSIFFGGTIADVLPAFIIAFCMALLSDVLSRRSLNVYASTFLLSLVGGVFSVCLCKLLNIIGLPCQYSYVMIGTIMILIPGLLTTNAVRDMFTGDLMSGTFQLLNGVLLAVVIAAGYGVSILALSPIADFVKLAPYTGWYNLTAADEKWFKAIMLMISGSLGAASVCLFFNLNLKRIGWAMLASVLTLGVYVGMLEAFKYNNDYVFLTVLVPTLFAAILSEIMARKIKIPATIILVPAIIALVPGSSLYYTMEAIVSPNMATKSASEWGVICLLTLMSIAVGICTATVLFHLFSPVKLKFYKKNKLAMLRKAEKFADANGNAVTAETVTETETAADTHDSADKKDG